MASQHAEGVAEAARGPRAGNRSTRDRVLDVVLDLLEEGGEAAVRIDDIKGRSGVPIGSIYHHFDNREGLIAAAQVRRFARYAEAEIAALSEIVRRSRDVEHFRASVRHLTLQSASEVRVAERWARVAVLASTRGRPELEEEIRTIQTRLTDEFQAHVSEGQARGYFRSDLDARALALFIEAYSLGLVLNEVDERAVSEGDWERVVWSVIDSFIVPV